MTMLKTTNVHRANVTLSHMVPPKTSSAGFATFDYGDGDETTTVFLTPEQTLAVAKAAMEAVADFIVCGALPPEGESLPPDAMKDYLAASSGTDDVQAVWTPKTGLVVRDAPDDDRPF